MPDFVIDGPADAERTFAFAHGAGAPMNVPFMNTVARGLAAEGIRVVRFEFPYMAARRKVPDRQPILLESWREVIRELGNREHLFIGGKSLGGRMATMVADEMGVRGVVCFGYPFHPPGRPEKVRTEHLRAMKSPLLILQGTRDPFGSPEEVASYPLSSRVRVEWIPDGDHLLKPHLDRAVAFAVAFILLHHS
jgi:predicted alpha/beta-hydrolase family hydrolase